MRNPLDTTKRKNYIVYFINHKLVFNMLNDKSKLFKYMKKGWYPYYLTYVPRLNKIVAVNYNKHNALVNCKLMHKYYDERATVKFALASEPFNHKVSEDQSMTEDYSLTATSNHSNHSELDDLFGIGILIAIVAVNIFFA